MRFGLIGTGYWARSIHAMSAAAHPAVDFVGVWGRNRERATALADEFGVRAFDSIDDLLEQVEALTFAVPPDVQSEIALRAARSGKHMLLEKPIALSPEAAHDLERAVAANDVASIVFFTQRFVPATAAWLEEAARSGGWVGGRVEYASNIYEPEGPFSTSAWRRERGALWDIGPHALAFLWPVLGGVTAVVAGRGPGDHVHLILRHSGSRTSTVSVSLTSPPAAIGRVVYFEGEQGRLVLPPVTPDPAETRRAYGAALSALISGSPHPCDVHFGARVVEVLSAAQQSLATGCWTPL
jgi:predicted dehydrogenase